MSDQHVTGAGETLVWATKNGELHELALDEVLRDGWELAEMVWCVKDDAYQVHQGTACPVGWEDAERSSVYCCPSSTPSSQRCKKRKLFTNRTTCPTNWDEVTGCSW